MNWCIICGRPFITHDVNEDVCPECNGDYQREHEDFMEEEEEKSDIPFQ